jgi:serine/threonine protein kinase
VRYYNTRYTKRIVYISFEVMNGGNLENAIKKKSFFQKPDIIYNIILQICGGLSYLHANNILHRDIKASNILLLSEDWASPQIKLGDFGLSHLLESGRYHLNTKEKGEGDVFYRSPEEIAGIPYGRGNDNWAVGIIILEMLSSIILCENITGKIFSQYVNFDDYVETILEDYCCIDDTPENSEYSNRIKNIVLGLLKKNPKERMRSEEIINTSNYNSNDGNVTMLPSIKIINKPMRCNTFDSCMLKRNVSTTNIKPVTILPKIINTEVNNKITRPFSA